MFTGLVECTGTVLAWEAGRLGLGAPFAGELSVGESVAVDGVCLTVEAFDAEGFWVTVVPTTLRRTTLGSLVPGRRVNLERALPVGGRLGGHVVQGHVDGVGTILERRREDTWEVLELSAPPEVLPYLVPRGSVAVQGVSLTVAGRPAPERFEVALVPHTCQVTTLGALETGSRVNLEADVLAKYVEGLLAGGGVDRA